MVGFGVLEFLHKNNAGCIVLNCSIAKLSLFAKISNLFIYKALQLGRKNCKIIMLFAFIIGVIY